MRFAPAVPATSMRVFAGLIVSMPLMRPLPDRRLTAWWLWNYSCGGSTAPTAQDSSMLCSVTQTPARLADSSLLAMGSASRAGFFCVSRNLVCTRRGLQRAPRLAFKLYFKGKRKRKKAFGSSEPKSLLCVFQHWRSTRCIDNRVSSTVYR